MMEKTEVKKFKKLIRSINFYPPYFFSGIKVVDYSPDFSMFKTRLKLTWYNKNLLGTAFGGSLYSMCDPFFMFILLIHLGDEYIVWDKTAKIDFKRPGKGAVFAEFRLSKEEIDLVRESVNLKGKQTFTYPCEIKDGSGEIIATLEKEVYVRKKNFKLKI